MVAKKKKAAKRRIVKKKKIVKTKANHKTTRTKKSTFMLSELLTLSLTIDDQNREPVWLTVSPSNTATLLDMKRLMDCWENIVITIGAVCEKPTTEIALRHSNKNDYHFELLLAQAVVMTIGAATLNILERLSDYKEESSSKNKDVDARVLNLEKAVLDLFSFFETGGKVSVRIPPRTLKTKALNTLIDLYKHMSTLTLR